MHGCPVEVSSPLEGQLILIDDVRAIGFEEAIDGPSVHEIGADEASEGERALNSFLPGLGEPEQQEGDESDGDLDADGIFGSADEAGDFEGLLDPAEEEFDGP